MIRQDIHSQLKDLCDILTISGFSIDQNYPKYINNKIIFSGFGNIAFTLKDMSYKDIYFTCLQENEYNFLLLDGAIIQMIYSFKNNKLIRHALSFMPNPEVEKFQDNPQEYEELYYGNVLFSDIIADNFAVLPIRFDYTPNHKDVDHPYVHATIGDNSNCRIPVNKPVSPKIFIEFVLRNFYYEKFLESGIKNRLKCNIKFSEKITNNEKKILHFSYN